MIEILSGVRWQLIIVLTCFTLIISSVEHHFMYLLAICMSSLKKCLFRYSAHFMIVCLFVFWYWAAGNVCVVWRLIPCQFFETKSIKRAVFVCFRFWVRKGWWSVAMIWTQLCVLILHPYVVLYAWRLPVSFIHKNVGIRFARHVLLLSMYVLLRNRSLLCPGYNCKHRQVVTLVISISTRLPPYFQLDYK